MCHGRIVRAAEAAAVVICAAAVLVLFPAALEAQPLVGRTAGPEPCDTVEFNYPTDEPALFDVNAMLPSFLRDQILLKRYIRDPRFLALRRLCSDTTAVDAIFLRSLEIARDDAGYALLISLIAMMDHFRLGIRIPLLGVLWLPLTTETDSVFRKRFTNLPKHILPDSIGSTERDQDKLQHFFGSALLAYSTNSPAFARAIGNLVEVGEDAFVVGGVNDDRDKFANRLGREFGMRLLEGDDVVPSDVLWAR